MNTSAFYQEQYELLNNRRKEIVDPAKYPMLLEATALCEKAHEKTLRFETVLESFKSTIENAKDEVEGIMSFYLPKKRPSAVVSLAIEQVLVVLNPFEIGYLYEVAYEAERIQEDANLALSFIE